MLLYSIADWILYILSLSLLLMSEALLSSNYFLPYFAIYAYDRESKRVISLYIYQYRCKQQLIICFFVMPGAIIK